VQTIKTAEIAEFDLFLIGGSLVSVEIENVILNIKKHTDKPVVIFPGSLLQISPAADALLLLSLISGRNPEYLIGNHVVAAPYLKKMRMDVIPTGYILIENNHTSSVEYISNTKPIPAHKHDIVMATAIAGEMLGHKLIYLESGSGASNPVSYELIDKVKSNISIPLIIGGGIKSKTEVENTFKAGADIVVVGNAIEKNVELLMEFGAVAR
jgi:putative glycerol-1-phosphate prenyltransferase